MVAVVPDNLVLQSGEVLQSKLNTLTSLNVLSHFVVDPEHSTSGKFKIAGFEGVTAFSIVFLH